jgi:hypothetical protein
MKNQLVFVRILTTERFNRLLSEIALRSVRIIIEIKDVGYYCIDDIIYYIVDDWGTMLAHLWCEYDESKKIAHRQLRQSFQFDAHLQ